eukprot:TRINITY_DN15118_c0_g1_i2.p1 TRINITY_DN15118_c0_g1~~TRINITY_DN15118_c0_g1_i2.p1  ORF type:complete len:223 (+),score=56.25 TRINITY_DN15118_c0_g1_i2:18-686(+)
MMVCAQSVRHTFFDFVVSVLYPFFFFLMIRRPPRSTQGVSSAASDVYKRQYQRRVHGGLEKLKKAVISCVASRLTYDEGEALKSLFLQIDTNKDGKISEEELEHYTIQFKNKEELKKLMKTMDLDNDGFIEYNEFLAAALPASSYLFQEKLKEAFSTFDENLDQKLSIEEIQNLIDSDKLLPATYWDDLMSKYDLNKDGFIDFEEFLEMMQMKEWEFVINQQ